MDWAPESVSCALLIGYHPDHRIWYIYDEWHHDGHESGALPTGEKVDRMVAAVTANGQREISEWVIDPSEDGVRVELKRLKAGRVIDAVADNDLGVKIGITYLDSGRVKISRARCPNFLGELSKLSWDRRAALVGQTRVDKASAGGGHLTDCLPLLVPHPPRRRHHPLRGARQGGGMTVARSSFPLRRATTYGVGHHVVTDCCRGRSPTATGARHPPRTSASRARQHPLRGARQGGGMNIAMRCVCGDTSRGKAKADVWAFSHRHRKCEQTAGRRRKHLRLVDRVAA